jgi:hypothetical protein
MVTKMNYLKKGLIIILVAFVFNVLETWLFGWNLHAQSTAEGFADLIAAIGMMIGLYFIFGHAVGRTVIIRVKEDAGIEKR